MKRSENEYRILTIKMIAPIKFEMHDDIIFIHKNLFIGVTKNCGRALGRLLL